MWRSLVAICLAMSFFSFQNAFAQKVEQPKSETDKAKIEKAIATIRHFDPQSVQDSQNQEIEKEMNEAWKTLMNSGKTGLSLLKSELKNFEDAKEKNDPFKLMVASLLWKLGEWDEVKTIASIWADADLTAQYQSVFAAALEIARTQDSRALPLLAILLHDKNGNAFIAQHSLPVEWPLTIIFVWGSFGSKGIEELQHQLKTSTDEVVLANAINLLTMDADLDSLPPIRKIAREGKGDAQKEAIKSLGFFGSPEDYDFLVSGLKSDDLDLTWNFVYALYEYEDQRAAESVVPLIGSKDPRLATEACTCLLHLLTPEAFEEVKKQASAAQDAEIRQRYALVAQGLCKRMQSSLEKYDAMSQDEKKKLIDAFHASEEEKYHLKKDDKRLTHDEFLKAAKEWQSNHRITGGEYSWVEDRHVVSIATPADIPLLIDVAAACYFRASDECLYETKKILEIAKWIGRTRYRKNSGLCEKVEPVEKK